MFSCDFGNFSLFSPKRDPEELLQEFESINKELQESESLRSKITENIGNGNESDSSTPSLSPVSPLLSESSSSISLSPILDASSSSSFTFSPLNIPEISDSFSMSTFQASQSSFSLSPLSPDHPLEITLSTNLNTSQGQDFIKKLFSNPTFIIVSNEYNMIKIPRYSQELQCFDTNQPPDVYYLVNPKQYNRILKRREARQKLIDSGKVVPGSREKKKKYMHESRHLHALKRQREQNGRFGFPKNKNETKKMNLIKN